ncbi:PKD domain-containing protein [Nocardioides daejeonensis]|uniref:PKD domain-containing protein n=1 Tax=Nocardioides daejeonensis TaxID=1046556 RepID=UPI000D74BD94|nr:PKD domain-containing protein [Nocardioides daejeonensis]
MRRSLSIILPVLVLFLPVCAALPATAASTPGGRLASEVAASGTPHVLDGRVLSVTRVGDTVLLGGTFDTARNDGSQTVLTRSNLLAFDANTGVIRTGFTPDPNGTVQKVLDAGDGQTVYVAGNFTSIGGVARNRIARIRISDGSVVSTFNAGTVSGQIRDLGMSRGRLWIGGAFTHVGGKAQRALATLDPTTGARTPFMSLAVAGIHNDGVTQVLKFDITPSGDRLVAVGNFDTLEGVTSHQLLMLDVGGAAAAPADFRTSFYTQACSQSFDSYMRDIDFAPDGSFFVVSTTGAYGGSNAPCDTTARWETGASGAAVQPSWVDYTGGDTTYGVEVTDAVVYVGGHFRWQNNAFRGDNAGQGAVAREGIAALDPINGLPFSWNPGRTKGVGVFDFLDTPQGLWVASDTDRIGNYQLKSRIARMRPDGLVFPATSTPQLPNDVYSIGATGVVRRPVTLTTVGAAAAVPGAGIDWNAVRGAFMLNGWLYLAQSDGQFVRRSFDGTTFGAAEAVNGSELVVPFTDWRSDVSRMTGLFYDSGRLYFTLTGSNQLYYRYFTAQSGVVGAKRLVASGNVGGIDFAQVRGMFGTGDALYWATPDGALRRIDWAQGAQSGRPVAGTASVRSGPGVDGVVWSGRAHVLFQDASGHGAGPNQPPQAAFTSSCVHLACTFDSAGTEDPDGEVVSRAWDFGDGGSGSGTTVGHTFAAAGQYPVTLTVTDDDGAVAQVTHQVQVQAAPAAAIAFAAAASANANATVHRVTVPAAVEAGDLLLLEMTVNTTGPSIADPGGWTQVEAQSGSNVQGRLWTRRATAADAGSVVSVQLSGIAKADLSISAYRATGAEVTVAAHGSAIDTASAAPHTAPALTSPAPGWLHTYWAAKSSEQTSWALPGSMTGRSASQGAGGGGIYAVAADSATDEPAGPVAGRTAVTDPAATRVVMFSVLLALG